jgi:hypothetical protein
VRVCVRFCVRIFATLRIRLSSLCRGARIGAAEGRSVNQTLLGDDGEVDTSINKKVVDISDAISRGAKAFLFAEYRFLAVTRFAIKCSVNNLRACVWQIFLAVFSVIVASAVGAANHSFTHGM